MNFGGGDCTAPAAEGRTAAAVPQATAAASATRIRLPVRLPFRLLRRSMIPPDAVRSRCSRAAANSAPPPGVNEEGPPPAAVTPVAGRRGGRHRRAVRGARHTSAWFRRTPAPG
ncbi:hypothetical protein GCM10010218_36130 [Streptomyces mashuensis]|uniref:Uncharacterized protein n=1 Tax=Streptomyces mashuensis TaxID=33904 RepID=A0A919B5H4_9ACTN|nr:hypothetical protein GCM10010218_36130 [Streptomyces mashuensis]